MRKVLLSACACEPGKGSESGIGWHWVRQIARFHQVWVMTRANNRQPIEAALVKEPLPNVHWVYFDLPRWIPFWKKGRRGVRCFSYREAYSSRHWHLFLKILGESARRAVPS